MSRRALQAEIADMRLLQTVIDFQSAELPREQMQLLSDIVRIQLKAQNQKSVHMNLNFAPDGAPNSNLPTLFPALREKFGLQLVSRRSPVEMVVIDRVGRAPAEN